MGLAQRDLRELIFTHVEQRPDALAYEYIDEANSVASVTYGQLASRASALGSELAKIGSDPVLLLYPQGIDYVVSVFAGFLAGVPVVPAYPPRQGHLDRLVHITKDAGIGCVLAPETFWRPSEYSSISFPSHVARLTVEQSSTATVGLADRRSDVAIIQYTSGSTAAPRGVMVTHDNVMRNTGAITTRFELREGSRAFSWLPPYHDMGLIGGILTPFAAGVPVRLMSPLDFLKHPLRWLRQISNSSATVSGGPNFAYELCTRRARRAESLEGLDLSGWQVAFNGAEPIRRRTLDEFAAKFRPVGFRSTAFLPCYGLAEATLLVAAGRWHGRDQQEGPVSCGSPADGQHVEVVDPDSGSPVAPGAEGEIWISGPHVTRGYWARQDDAELFGTLDGLRMLRTGDLGYLSNGELFVTGRVKDVIVHRGVNHHAIDIENAAQAVDTNAVRAAAAFQVEAQGRSIVAIVAEVAGAHRPGRPASEELAASIRQGVLATEDLLVDVVALVPAQSIPRTSSGKIRRGCCREMLIDGRYDNAIVIGAEEVRWICEARAHATTSDRLTALVCGIAEEVCEARQCLPADSLLQLGVDSLRAAEAAAVLEDAIGLPGPMDVLLRALTPERIADSLIELWTATGAPLAGVQRRVVAATGVSRTEGD